MTSDEDCLDFVYTVYIFYTCCMCDDDNQNNSIQIKAKSDWITEIAHSQLN